MFVWMGCDINPKFIEYREKVKECNSDLQLSETALKLPQHISLKITFEMDESLARHCIKDAIDLFQTIKPFTARIEGLELHDGIIWLKVAENEQLRMLHTELDELAISYAVKPHELDKQFIFHSTVIMDGDNEKLAVLYERLKKVSYPKELKINTFLIGHSEDNVTYKIDRRIKVK